ncbi:MAG: Transketolase 1 [Alphaproteobacteria bacterium MarineAlpha5_Bin8]|nr:MAG: Transketolase 1 [Alphaproteobacteria bacterium MarineAlpha5_Bin7]PPR48388.1 MAG: Transketolase 1 [Alphaproteobacteria bacterium MarineAlpha5_Bin8]PPR54385.1 MAG: Transketolase 1 [Alphaproteobacteria bacterium MarineAlpha5_Bin6]|tara:strand:+ start:2102 stop:4081 length:1980 start_codon:yes stop_codon:yes gene_type:complete
MDSQIFQKLANCIRFLSIDAVEKAKSGHPGMPMGMADIATSLYKDHLKFDPLNPKWLDRDRLVISNGHGSMLLYACLYLSGYKDITIEDIKNFRQLGSSTAGHPEYLELSGIETTTGPLSQGLANGVGMALAEKILQSKFSSKIINHFTYVFAGDGCLMEGLSHEACSLAGHLNLSKLIVFFDNNSISIDGSTNLSTSDDVIKRFSAYGWQTLSIDGHNQEEISAAINKAKSNTNPTLISCKTKIGFGSPNKESSSSSHGSPLGEEEVNLTRKNLNWSYEPFEIPNDILDIWRNFSKRNDKDIQEWKNEFNKIKDNSEYKKYFSSNLSPEVKESINVFKNNHLNKKTSCATRKASESSLDIFTQHLDNLIGGSADLTGSNNTKASNMKIISKNDFSGRYIYYGVREHAMAGIMNGLALHGGLKPYGGTFLVFTDYCRPSIRLASIMKLPVIYVMTHDSIGLGEDGPTHQPVEHLASLRSIPNLNVIRPCDIIETIESWEAALKANSTPTVLVLTRQNLPLLRNSKIDKNYVELGAYPVIDFDQYDATVLATGSEVEIAVEASNNLKVEDFYLRVISFPSWEFFSKQDIKYKNKILGKKPIFAIEAAVINGWEKFVPSDNFLGMNSFGASAPYKELYDHFGINSENLIKMIKNNIKAKVI